MIWTYPFGKADSTAKVAIATPVVDELVVAVVDAVADAVTNAVSSLSANTASVVCDA